MTIQFLSLIGHNLLLAYQRFEYEANCYNTALQIGSLLRVGPLLYLAVQILLRMGPLSRFITTRCSCKAGQRKLKLYGDNIVSSFLQSSLLPSNRAGHTNFDFEAQDEYNFHFVPATLLSLIVSLPRVLFKCCAYLFSESWATEL